MCLLVVQQLLLLQVQSLLLLLVADVRGGLGLSVALGVGHDGGQVLLCVRTGERRG